jgi:hypothetical protein
MPLRFVERPHFQWRSSSSATAKPSPSALQARRFRLLARSLAKGGDLDEALTGWSEPLDALLVGGANEFERQCGQAVATLEAERPMPDSVLDWTKGLPPDTASATYYALSEARQVPLAFYAVWIRPVDGVEDVMATFEELVEEASIMPVSALSGTPVEYKIAWRDAAIECADFRTRALRRHFGLDADLTPEEEAIIDEGEAYLELVLGSAATGQHLSDLRPAHPA